MMEDIFAGLMSAGYSAEKLDELFNMVDQLLLENHHDKVSQVLKTAIFLCWLLPVSASLSLLAITKPWKARFKAERERLGERLHARLVRERDVGYADEVLRGVV